MGKMRNFDDRYFAEYQCGIIPQNTGCINSAFRILPIPPALDNHALKQEAEVSIFMFIIVTKFKRARNGGPSTPEYAY